MGDRLVANNNAFATSMSLRHQQKKLDQQALLNIPKPTGKILLLVHGLCMHDQQWHSNSEQTGGHGEVLALTLGYTPVYLRYNSGLHVSENGRELSTQLEQLIADWPVPVDELSVLSYSMGGLLIRSACYYAEKQTTHWRSLLKKIVFLGTPHHGAPLERAGSWLDSILASTRYSAPFIQLSQLRSAGITDLRYGNVIDQDWQHHDRFERQQDHREKLALPDGVDCFAMAASTTAKPNVSSQTKLLGDGLVTVRSALGQHDDPHRCLAFKDTQLGYAMNHMALLNHSDVTQQLNRWFK